jgi:hypothetical protein
VLFNYEKQQSPSSLCVENNALQIINDLQNLIEEIKLKISPKPQNPKTQ